LSLILPQRGRIRQAAGGATNDAFEFVITMPADYVTSTNDTFNIPITGTGYNYDVDWGDGNTSTNVTGATSHSYPGESVGNTRAISITTGTGQPANTGFPRIYFANAGDKDWITSITNFGAVGWTSMENAFFGCDKITSVSGYAEFSNVTSLKNWLRTSSLMTTFDCSEFITTSTLTSLDTAFYATKLTTLDLSPLNMTAVIHIGSLCYGNTFLTTVDLTGCTGTIGFFNSASTFGNCPVLASVAGLDGLDLSSAGNMNSFITGGSGRITQAQYDAALIAWDANGYGSRALNCDMGGSTYTSGGSADTAHAALSTAGWTFTDGGAV